MIYDVIVSKEALILDSIFVEDIEHTVVAEMVQKHMGRRRKIKLDKTNRFNRTYKNNITIQVIPIDITTTHTL